MMPFRRLMDSGLAEAKCKHLALYSEGLSKHVKNF